MISTTLCSLTLVFKGLPEGWVSQGDSLLLVMMDEAGLWLGSQVKVAQLRVNRKTLISAKSHAVLQSDGSAPMALLLRHLLERGAGMCR